MVVSDPVLLRVVHALPFFITELSVSPLSRNSVPETVAVNIGSNIGTRN